MKISIIKYSCLLTFVCTLSACGGGNSASPEPEVAPLTNLTFMVDGIIAENTEHADHVTWDLNNFTVNDDIEGNTDAETAINAKVDAMVVAEEAKL